MGILAKIAILVIEFWSDESFDLAASALLTLVIALLTVSLQTFKAARTNVINSLKYE